MIEAIFTLHFQPEEMPSDPAAWIENLLPESKPKAKPVTSKGPLHVIAAEFPNLERITAVDRITALAEYLTVQSELDWSCRQSYSIDGHVILIRPGDSFAEN